MRENSRDPLITVNIGGLRVHLAAARPREWATADAVARLSKRVEAECPGTIVVGLPLESVDLCAAAISYLHSLEHAYSSGRVKSLPLRFVMEYMGLRQIRDVVNLLRKNINIIVIISLDRKCVDYALRVVEEESIGSPVLHPGTCSLEIVSTIVEEGVLRGARLD